VEVVAYASTLHLRQRPSRRAHAFSRSVDLSASDLKKRRMTDMSQFLVAAISNDVLPILVPVVFTRGLPNNPPRNNTFLISQTFVAINRLVCRFHRTDRKHQLKYPQHTYRRTPDEQPG
jgi:hypothetical protein